MELRGLIDKLTAFTQKEAREIAHRYTGGEITLVEFETQMQGLLKSAHIVAATVGRGGRSLMDAADWGRVGAKIKWQYQYLAKFVRKIASGRVSDPLTASRAQAYASSIYISYARTFMESQTETIEPPPDNGHPVTDENILVRLITHSDEGCDECAADEAEGWMRPEDMGEIGTRICGDFCKCELEFSDEIGADNGESN